MAAAFLLISGALHADVDLHVAADAKPGGNGSSVAPLASIEAARDALRDLRSGGRIKLGEQVRIRIRSGVYPRNAGFELDARDGGSPGAPVIYQAERPLQAELHGGLVLDPAGFVNVTDPAVLSRLDPQVRDKVRVLDLGSLHPGAFPEFPASYPHTPVAPWLYQDGAPLPLAGWPNGEDWAVFTKAVDTGLAKMDAADAKLEDARPGSFLFEDDRPKRWKLDDGVWLFGYWTHDWSCETIRIAGYDAETKIIRLAAPHAYGIAAGTWGAKARRFRALNTLDELDVPGEWYLDRTKKLLYLYPDRPWPMARLSLATLVQPIIRMDGVKHLTLAGLDLGFSHGQGIVVRDSEDVEIAGCRISNLAGGGISIEGGRGNRVLSCDMFHLGGRGIQLDGGDRATLTPSGHLAENNHIHHYGLFQRTYAPGVGVNGCGQIVRHNLIHDAPHNAVLYGGNEHLFEFNEIHHVVMETGDAGAFYSGRDWTSQGNRIRHNYIHDLGGGSTEITNTMGVYLDDCDCGDTIEGNIFLRAGRAIMIGGGRDNRVLNNLVVDCPIGIHLDSRGMTWKQWNERNSSWDLIGKAERLNYQKPPWSDRYPRLAAIMADFPREPLHNVIRRNIIVNADKKVADFDGNVMKLLEKLDIADNWVVQTRADKPLPADLRGFAMASDPALVIESLGLTEGNGWHPKLGADSPLRKILPAFEPIPFERIGPVSGRYRHAPSAD